MHADDAVQWWLWGEGVLAQAQREQKLIFISSGYFACHWCHVMQRESFQHQLIASLLNNTFIPVKLDRELNPELDGYLLAFVEKSRGVAGWPLNVFLTPQGHPLTGSGYLPADEFLALIKRLQVRWENEGEGLSRLAAEAAAESSPPLTPAALTRQELIKVVHQRLLEALFEKADLLAGGIGEGAKFPNVPLMQALMSLQPDAELDEFIQLTLAQMADNGLRDHLSGGFFRYSVDPGWLQPHFEKMLYDNAQLATLYFDAAQRWKSAKWHRIGVETLDAVLEGFAYPGGGYISSLSALDGQGVEGGYYLWSRGEIEKRLPIAEWRLFSRTWQLQGSDGWAGALPLPRMDTERLADTLRMPLAEAQQWQTRIRRSLLQQRASRSLPRDEKRLAAWNGLLLTALARGVAADEESTRYRQAGEALQHYLSTLWDGEQLWRLRGIGGGVVTATLEDYAYVAQGLLDWSEAVNNREARILASRLTGEAFYRFFGDGHWSAEGLSLLPPRRLLSDNVVPSAAAVLASLGRRFAEASPMTPDQINSILFADPQGLLQRPLAYPGYVAEIRRLEGRGSRLSLE